MVAVEMNHRGCTLQVAVDFVGYRCKQCVERFEDARQNLPSWGQKVDEVVQKYVLGLQLVSSLHWSFETERYFGKLGPEVKKKRIVTLLPKRPLEVGSQCNCRI